MYLEDLNPFFDHLATLPKNAEWPKEQLALCNKYNLYDWFATKDPSDTNDQISASIAFLKLSEYCQITSFIFLQSIAAYIRIQAANDPWLNKEIINPLHQSQTFITNGISQVLNSCQHLEKPALTIEKHNDHFMLNGFTPWVSGANVADYVLVAGVTPDESVISIALPMTTKNITTEPPAELLSFNETNTSKMTFKQVSVHQKWLVSEISNNEFMHRKKRTPWIVFNAPIRALGLCTPILNYVKNETQNRPKIKEAYRKFDAEYGILKDNLFNIIAAEDFNKSHEIRTKANNFITRLSQAALIIAKGRGFTLGHPTQQWCREALFFRIYPTDFNVRDLAVGNYH